MSFERQKIHTRSLPANVLAKWPRPVLDEGFTPFPKRLLRCLGEVFHGPNGLDELRVVLAIADFKRPNLTRFPSADYLAWIAGMPTESFMEKLNTLSGRGLISIAGDEEELDVSLEGLAELIAKHTPDEG